MLIRIPLAHETGVPTGRFNLSPWDTDSPAGSIPIIVVPRGQAVTVLLAGETVVGTTVMLLQPGDRILVPYRNLTISARQEREHGSHAARMQDAAPVITRFPFYLDAGQRFNAWIVAHLPAQTEP